MHLQFQNRSTIEPRDPDYKEHIVTHQRSMSNHF